jgi:4-carboxymuconolactone decarboxylase
VPLSEPRVPLIEPGARAELADVEHAILAARGRISPLYQALLNSPPLAHGWEALLTALRNHSALAADLRELVILRVAVLNRAPFEFEAHLPHARKAGVGEDKLAAIRHPAPGAPFDAWERAVLALTDAMTRDVQVSDVVFAPVAERLNERALTELVATVAAYNMVSRVLEVLRIGH